MKQIRTVLSLLLIAATLLTLCGCSAGRVRASANASRVVARVGNVEILYEELYYLAENYIADRVLAKGEDVMDDPAEREALAAFIKDRLLSREVLLRDIAADYDIPLTKGKIGEQVSEYLDDVMEQVFDGDRGAYIESLKKDHLTDRHLRTLLAISDYLPTEIVLEMIDRGEIDTSDEHARELIDSDACIRTVQVVIGKDNGFSDEVNRANAAQVRATVAEKTGNGTRYTAMCEAIGGPFNNDHGDMMGDGYYFVRGEMDAAYEEAAFALTEYGVSEVLELDDGYYIIMRLPKESSYIDAHFQTLKETSYFIGLNAMVEERMSTLTLQMTDFGNSLDLCDLPAIDVDGGSRTMTVVIVVACAVALGVGALIALRVKKTHKGIKKA